MKHALNLGFIALTDAAPLIVAHERGMFAEEGLDVTLHREVSWATIRDKVGAGVYQGAHMLAPMLLAENIAAGGDHLIAPLALNAHGAGIGVSNALAQQMESLAPEAPLSAAALAKVTAARRSANHDPLRFAAVFPTSIHNYLLRFWAGSAGVDPDNDMRIAIAAPTAVAARFSAGAIDGFCVGAPWPSLCEAESGAKIALESGAFWPGGPDKVLGLSKAWADREPEIALALTRAVLRASGWADTADNTPALASLLARESYVGAPAALIAERLGAASTINLRFGRAAFPWRSHAAWLLSQMLRWGHIEAGADLARALDAYRPDMFTTAAAQTGLHTPSASAAASPWPRADAGDAFETRADEADAIRNYARAFTITRLRR